MKMGLLEALDFFKQSQIGMTGECIELEYQLHSWGEIYPPFIGDREHSIAARYILTEFPFKLFSSSTPYDDPLPQKLCLTFKAPYEVRSDSKNFHSAAIYDDEEIAKEFAAFLSLVTRRRVFVNKGTRYEGLPIEKEVDIYQHAHFQEKQRLKEIKPREIYQLLYNLQAMKRKIANSFILAMRLYHSAIEMMYLEPEFSYLFLVMSLEAISSVVYEKEDVMPSDVGNGHSELDRFLDSTYSSWRKHCDISTPELKKQVIKMLLNSAYFTRLKISKFVSENVPDRFWIETTDDGKPDYLTSVFESSGQERISHSDPTISYLEKIKKENLIQVIQDIYKARSNLIHAGIQLPASIVVGHFRTIPINALEEIIQTTYKGETKVTSIPPLITFERLVSYSMVEFLNKQQDRSTS